MQILLPARVTRATAALAAGSLLALSASAQTVIGDGFARTGLSTSPVFLGSYQTLDDGTRVVFDGQSIDLYTVGNGFLLNLGALPGFVFNSFVEVDPTRTFAVVGESTNGDLFKVQLDGSGMTPLTNLAFNFDGVFESPTSILVSAATCGFGCGNEVYRVDTTTGATSLVASVSGPSGPLALADDGALYYGLVDLVNPTGSGVLRWTATQLAAGVPLSEADAATVFTGLAAINSLAVDPVFGNLVLSESVFNGTSRILEVDPSDGTLVDVVVESDFSLSNVELLQDAGDGHFHRYQPEDGVYLHYASTDFIVFDDINTIRPQQPTTSFAQVGPAATVSIAGGEPNGAALVVFTQNAFYDPSLITTMLGGTDFQFHAAAPLNRLRRSGPLLLPLDANGAADFHYFDAGNLAGTLTFQALVTDASGTIVGGSTAVQN